MSKDITETLQIMADNIDATRPECDYSLAHKRIDDADIAALREAADLITALRQANAEVFETGIRSVRDTAELVIELREVKRERDDARREVCARATGHETIRGGVEFDIQFARDEAQSRGWDCFKEDSK